MEEKLSAAAFSDSQKEDTCIIVTLLYMDNVNRVTVDTIEIERTLPAKEIFEVIVAAFVSHGYEEPPIDKLYIVSDGWQSYDPGLLLKETETKIVYSRILALNNAHEVHREAGAVYYINTREKPHLEYPHIHVKYSGEEISISLTDFVVTGGFKNHSRMKIAKKYVKKNQESLLEKWHEIINGDNYEE